MYLCDQGQGVSNARLSSYSTTTISFTKGDEGRETTEFVTKLDTWDKDRRFVVSRVLKPAKDRSQLSFLEGDEFEYFYFVTNTELPSEKVVIAYEKRGNAENYIKEAKYDMAVGHLLLQSFWANEAIFQLMMLTYNLFLLFKMDFANGTEYRQQIKTFRIEVHIPGWEDHQNGKKCSVETLNKLSLSRDLCKKPFLKKRFFMSQSVICI